MPNRITDSLIAEAYAQGKAVYDAAMPLSDAINELASKGSMNRNSAKDYIRNFLQMMKGMEYQRTLNSRATEYFLASIYTDYGQQHLKLALESVQKHLDYYEGIGKSKQKSIREIVGNYWAKVTSETSLENNLNEFFEKVERSFDDGQEKRLIRLNAANRKPDVVTVQAVVYRRNPDVVAEVLFRASGYCERCKKHAPFSRGKDGTPYLEVHHKKQLANDGEDTLENAIALCPNCHRELHFG